MAWTAASFIQDTETDGVGTGSATFTYPDSTTFTYSQRVNVSTGQAAFITNAKAAETAFGSSKTTRESREAAILAGLNA